jgi:hypothetical protein
MEKPVIYMYQFLFNHKYWKIIEDQTLFSSETPVINEFFNSKIIQLIKR